MEALFFHLTKLKVMKGVKYIKFTEDHKSRVHLKGAVAQIPKDSLKAWKDSGIVEEATKEDFEAFKSEKLSKAKAAVKEAKEEAKIEAEIKAEIEAEGAEKKSKK